MYVYFTKFYHIYLNVYWNNIVYFRIFALLLAYLCCPRKRVSRRLFGRRASVAFANAPAGARVADPSRPRADAPVLLRVAGSYTPSVFMFDTSHSAQVLQRQHVQEMPSSSPSTSFSAAVHPSSAERIPDIYIEMAPADSYWANERLPSLN